MEASLEDLCSKINDIESCLYSIFKGNMNEGLVMDLSAKMSTIERELTYLEDQTRVQLPLVEEVEKTIATLKEISRISQHLPGPDFSDITFNMDNVIEVEDDERIPKKKPLILQKQERQSKSSLSKDKSVLFREPQLTLATKEEVSMACSRTHYRVTADKINACINEVNRFLLVKYQLLNSKNVKEKNRMLYEKFKSEQDDIKEPFFTEEDTKDMDNFRTNSKTYLTILSSLGKIKYEKSNNIGRYFIK